MSSKPFSSEALLQQAVAGLLARIPDITGVQILQGSQEMGKDLVFYIRGGFGESVLCACIVKNSRITGNATSSASARNLFLQARQAFEASHTDSFGKDANVERVYVITPFDISPSAISSIKLGLQDRSGQVLFIGGTILFDLFKRYWPDFLASEASTSESRFKQINKRPKKDKRTLDVFLSYAVKDTDEARIIFDKLRKENITAFQAEKSIKAGEIWEERIKEALRSCRNFWILVTPNSLNSEWVITEWAAAWALNKRIVPILLRCGPEDLPKRLQSYHSIDFHHIDDAIETIKENRSL